MLITLGDGGGGGAGAWEVVVRRGAAFFVLRAGGVISESLSSTEGRVFTVRARLDGPASSSSSDLDSDSDEDDAGLAAVRLDAAPRDL